MTTSTVRVAITGAAGHIGYALVFQIAKGNMFGPHTRVCLQLIELESQLSALEGVKMELEDCGFPLLESVICTADLSEGFADADWALLVGAVPRKQGMERSDLLKINGGIFTEQGRVIDAVAKPSVQVLVVGNPCNTNALIAQQSVRRVDPHRFYAMTLLDQHRAVGQLASKAGVTAADVEGCVIWGNHSATQFPDIASATINHQPARSVIQDDVWLETTFLQNVQQRGAHIIQARGLSSAASAANAVVDTVAACSGLWGDRVFSLACTSDGAYGVDAGLVFSFPCRYEAGKVVIVPGYTQDDYGQGLFAVTLAELRGERDAVSALGLI